MAYAHSDAASAPGPGMTSLVAKRPGASLALDLRDSQGLAEAGRSARDRPDRSLSGRRSAPLPLGGAHRDPVAAAASIRAELSSQLAMLKKFDNDALLARRYERLMSYGL